MNDTVYCIIQVMEGQKSGTRISALREGKGVRESVCILVVAYAIFVNSRFFILPVLGFPRSSTPYKLPASFEKLPELAGPPSCEPRVGETRIHKRHRTGPECV